MFHHHSFRVVIDCLRIAAERCIELRSEGYDLLFFIEKSFHNDICSALDSYQKRAEAAIVKVVSCDRWVSVKEKRRVLPDGTHARIAVTSAVVDFEAIVREYLDDVEDIYSINVGPRLRPPALPRR